MNFTLIPHQNQYDILLKSMKVYVNINLKDQKYINLNHVIYFNTKTLLKRMSVQLLNLDNLVKLNLWVVICFYLYNHNKVKTI